MEGGREETMDGGRGEGEHRPDRQPVRSANDDPDRGFPTIRGAFHRHDDALWPNARTRARTHSCTHKCMHISA